LGQPTTAVRQVTNNFTQLYIRLQQVLSFHFLCTVW